MTGPRVCSCSQPLVCLCACRYSCENDVGGRVLQLPGCQNTAPRVEPSATTISRVPTKHVCTPGQHDTTQSTYHWPLLSAPYTDSNVVYVDVRTQPGTYHALSCICTYVLTYICMYNTMYTFATEHNHYLCIQHCVFMCVCTHCCTSMHTYNVVWYIHVCTPFCNLLTVTIRVSCTSCRVAPCNTTTVCYLINLDLDGFCINMRTGSCH